jgi:hypothetical protein
VKFSDGFYVFHWDFLLAHCFNHSLIFIVSADPNPNEIFAIRNRKGPVVDSNSDRPKLADFFEMEGWM